MNFIDLFNFSQYFNREGDGSKARVGHVNAVIEELTALQDTVDNLPAPTQTYVDGVTITGAGTQGSPYVANIPAPYNYTVIDISSAQILNLQGSPVQLLPAPPANQYYTFYGYIEYTPGNVAYAGTGKLMIGDTFEYVGYILNNWWLNNTNTTKRKIEFNSADLAGTNTSPLKDATFIDKAVYFTLFSGSNFTNGNGTIKIKLYYKLLSWG